MIFYVLVWIKTVHYHAEISFFLAVSLPMELLHWSFFCGWHLWKKQLYEGKRRRIRYYFNWQWAIFLYFTNEDNRPWHPCGFIYLSATCKWCDRKSAIGYTRWFFWSEWFLILLWCWSHGNYDFLCIWYMALSCRILHKSSSWQHQLSGHGNSYIADTEEMGGRCY